MTPHEETLYIAVFFLALTLFTLVSSLLVFNDFENGVKLAFLILLVFIGVLSFRNRIQYQTKVANWKEGLTEHILIQSQATYYEHTRSSETIDTENPDDQNRAQEGSLLASKTYVIFQSEQKNFQLTINRSDIFTVFKGRLQKSGKPIPKAFRGVLAIRLPHALHKFIVPDVDRWLRLFDEERFGAQQYQDLKRKSGRE
ncbi:hypothetical protein KJ765_06435 [Candidatus Micrarchaeota archaeon]|nr:hypothetical protein [Candidatus Micrarchaeota archaeon]